MACALAAVLAAVCSPARAQTHVISPAPEKLAVTIYRDDLALISETRTIELPAGVSTIEFQGVSDRIIPQSALLQSFEGFTIERNFDFDLLSPASFFESAVGETVTVTRTNRATGRVTQVPARVVSAGAGEGVVFETDAGVEAYQCSGLSESIGASRIPEALKARPTLSIEVDAEAAGPKELVISYLASGFGWRADYVLTLGEDAVPGDLIGWLTVTNETSVGVDEAETAIVAGSLQRLAGTESPASEAATFFARCWPRGSTKRGIFRDDAPPPPPRGGAYARKDAMAFPAAAEAAMDQSIVVTGQRMASREDLGDYKLYRTPEPTTLAAHQTKQVLFLDANTVGIEKLYVYEFSTPQDGEGDALPATVEYRIDNSRGGTLAEPLPAGAVRVMTTRASGEGFFLGEDDVRDMAVDLPVKVKAAAASDVRMRTTITKASEKPAGDGVRRQLTVTHEISNALDEPATVEISLGNDFGAAMRIDRSNRPRKRGEALPTWRIEIAPGSSETLAYRAAWVE